MGSEEEGVGIALQILYAKVQTQMVVSYENKVCMLENVGVMHAHTYISMM